MSSYPYYRRVILIICTFTSLSTVTVDYSWATTSIDDKQYARNKTLILGKVSDNPKKHYSSIQSMANYLASQLGDLGIKKGDVLLAKDNLQMVKYLNEGRIDIVTESVVSSAIFIQQAQAIPIARKWKNATPSYQSLIFVRKDSAIYSIEDLIGKRIALEDPGSTTAFFIPIATLRLKGLSVVEQLSLRTQTPADAVGAYITNNDKTISPLVYGGVVEAGALSSIDWLKNKRVPEQHRRAFRIIYQSEVWPRMIELVAAHVNPVMRQRIKNILIKAHLDPKAKSALKTYQKTSRFDKLKEHDWAALVQAQHMLSTMKWSR